MNRLVVQKYGGTSVGSIERIKKVAERIALMRKTGLDIVVVVNIIVETYTPSDNEFSAADMNSDGVVDVLDIVILVNAILGY